jgi:hypothetical protein
VGLRQLASRPGHTTSASWAQLQPGSKWADSGSRAKSRQHFPSCELTLQRAPWQCQSSLIRICCHRPADTLLEPVQVAAGAVPCFVLTPQADVFMMHENPIPSSMVTTSSTVPLPHCTDLSRSPVGHLQGSPFDGRPGDELSLDEVLHWLRGLTDACHQRWACRLQGEHLIRYCYCRPLLVLSALVDP